MVHLSSCLFLLSSHRGGRMAESVPTFFFGTSPLILCPNHFVVACFRLLIEDTQFFCGFHLRFKDVLLTNASDDTHCHRHSFTAFVPVCRTNLLLSSRDPHTIHDPRQGHILMLMWPRAVHHCFQSFSQQPAILCSFKLIIIWVCFLEVQVLSLNRDSQVASYL